MGVLHGVEVNPIIKPINIFVELLSFVFIKFCNCIGSMYTLIIFSEYNPRMITKIEETIGSVFTIQKYL